MPVIEAQAFGTPVISRPIPAVREIMTSRDILAGNMSVSALTEAMLSYLKTSSLEQECQFSSRSGIDLQRHLSRFDCRDVARAVYQVYCEARNERR